MKNTEIFWTEAFLRIQIQAKISDQASFTLEKSIIMQKGKEKTLVRISTTVKSVF